jgi:Tol biopolymer transport system component
LPAALTGRILLGVRSIPSSMTLACALLAAASAGGQAPARVSSRGLPVVAPDGRTIAFISDRDESANALFVIGVDGAGERRLSSRQASRPTFADRGRQLRFAGAGADSGKVFALTIDGGATRELANVPGRNAVLSPDGALAAYLSGPWTSTALMVSRADGSNARRVAGGRATAWNAAWSPDGRRLAYTHGDSGATLQVHIVNADGSQDRPLTAVPADEGSAQMPAWSADGSMIAVQVGSGKSHTAHIWTVDVRSGRATKLAAHQGYLDEVPAWFPDGTRLAFQSDRSGRMEIWVMNVDGTAARQVTGVQAVAGTPQPSAQPPVQPAVALPDPPPPVAAVQPDSDAVRSVLQRYLRGLRFNDVASLKDAFWPGARLFWVRKDGSVGQLTQDEWYAGFAASAGKEEKGELVVSGIEVSGDAARAKVVETYATSEYVDFISLLKLGGRWWIVNKVYTAHSVRATPPSD